VYEVGAAISISPFCSKIFPRFLYMAFICVDANFRLKNQLMSNYSADPGLGTGMSYMVERRPYEQYVLSRVAEAEVR
jgi:hypothetical protein